MPIYCRFISSFACDLRWQKMKINGAFIDNFLTPFILRFFVSVPSRKAVDVAVILDRVNDGKSSSDIKILVAELEVCCRQIVNQNRITHPSLPSTVSPRFCIKKVLPVTQIMMHPIIRLLYMLPRQTLNFVQFYALENFQRPQIHFSIIMRSMVLSSLPCIFIKPRHRAIFRIIF